MNWVRWCGLLLLAFSLANGFMMGRFWAVLHLAQPPVQELNPLNQGTFLPPSDPMVPVSRCIIASLVALTILAPAVYLLNRSAPRLAPYVILSLVVGAIALPFLWEILTPPSVRLKAEQHKYANMLIANSFFSVMGALLGTGLVALADGSPKPSPVVAEKSQPKQKKKPRRKPLNEISQDD